MLIERPCTHKIQPNVRISPKATELPRGSEMTLWGQKPTSLKGRFATPAQSLPAAKSCRTMTQEDCRGAGGCSSPCRG